MSEGQSLSLTERQTSPNSLQPRLNQLCRAESRPLCHSSNVNVHRSDSSSHWSAQPTPISQLCRQGSQSHMLALLDYQTIHCRRSQSNCIGKPVPSPQSLRPQLKTRFLPYPMQLVLQRLLCRRHQWLLRLSRQHRGWLTKQSCPHNRA